MFYTVKIQPQPDDKKRYTEEKDYRQKQLNAAKWLNGISGGGAVIAFFALVALAVNAFMIHRQLSAAEDANKIARQAMETQTRPWVGIDGDPFDMQVTESNITFKLNLRNYGQSPALGVSSTPWFVITHTKDFTSRVFDRYTICSRAGSRAQTQPSGNVEIIFPGKDESVTQKVYPAPDRNFKLDPSDDSLTLVGCIAYLGSLGGPYYTRVVYKIPVKDKTATVAGRPVYDIQ